MNESSAMMEQFLSSVISTLNSEEIYDVMMDALIELLNPDGLLLMSSRKTGHLFEVTRKWGDISVEKDYCISDDSVIEQLRASDGYVAFNSTSIDILADVSIKKQRWLGTQDITAFYALKYNHAVIGLLFIAKHDHTPPTVEQVKRLHKIGYYTSYALRNANLYLNAYRASITDDLTALYNRKHAFQCIENACLEELPVSLILFDIDDFKLYNELYGAEEGDALIRRTAQILLREIDSSDMAFRFGADEFMVLRRGNDLDAARNFGARVIDEITHARTEDKVWDVTITCGISVYPDISEDSPSLLHNAEQAVYYGKSEGKGQISVYLHGMEDRSQNPDIHATYERVAPTIYALTAAIDAKDSYTFIHSMNVSKYAVALAEDIGMNANDIEIIREAAMLHDIGKISIPEHILKKTSRLTDDEYEIMKTHVENSSKMIRYLPDMDYVIPAVLGHHERYDGKGYPRGLAGEDIPLMARILTVADCFDAMTAKRPYKPAMPVSFSVGELLKNSGTQFDPDLVTHFIDLINNGRIAF